MRYIFLFMLLVLSACAHQDSVNVVSDEYPVCPETTENDDGTVTFNLCYVLTASDYKDMYLTSLADLGLYRDRPNLDKEDPHWLVEYINVTVTPSFDTNIGVTFVRWIDKRSKEDFTYLGDVYWLKVNYWDPEDDQYKNFYDYSLIRSTVSSFITNNISEVQFEKVYNHLAVENFYKEVQPSYFKSSCTDGTFYYIEFIREDGANFIGRHSCDEGFVEKFAYAHDLFELAGKKFPEVAGLLEATRKEIDEESFQPLLSVD
ncbi:MAG: hypothetical protein MRY72_06835 [Aquisalinus sp.]|nr:hypothetical protein [Aquisalinus sp.]